MRVALFQPDIPQNTGSILRLSACFSVPVDIIGPSGFVWENTKLRRAGMDYCALACVTHHDSWNAFLDARAAGLLGRTTQGLPPRMVLLTTRGATPLTRFCFQPDDLILMGRESAGVPDSIHNAADERVVIPMAPGTRSLNVAMTAAITLAEALRQTDSFPTP